MMKRVHWKWLLPLVQLTLALACHVYEPHEYRALAYRDRAVNNPEYTFQHSPALSGRISRGINFPALVLGYPLRNQDDAIYQHNSEYTLIWIAPKDLGFFGGILLFWYWVGRKLEEHLGRSSGRIWPRKARVAEAVGGVVFGLLTAAYAGQMIAEKWLPARQIGLYGVAWASALLIYFIWRFTREFISARN